MNVLITGGSSGIGLELAKQFAKNRHNLILVARNQEKLEKAKEELREYTVNVEIIVKDLSLDGASKELFEETRDRSIDVLVNNAGFSLQGTFVENDIVVEKNMINLNITALTELTKYFLPQMISRGSGKILNVASTAGFQPGPYMAVYFATKAYVLSFSEALREELKDTGVSVTALCPGPTETNFAKRAGTVGKGVFSGNVLDASYVAEIGYQALIDKKPVAITGLTNKLLIFSLRLAPRKLVPKIVARLMTK